MVFEEELNHVIHHDRYFVEAETSKLSLSQLLTIVKNENKGFHITGFKKYAQADRTLQVTISEINKNPGNASSIKSEKQEKEGGSIISLLVYINPYNGKILEVEDRKESFFKKVEMIHRFLLSRKGGVGHYIMSYSSVFFLFILITGLILWWPKTKNILKQRLMVKWDGTVKRLTYDLHVVIGFYTSVFLIVMVTTGLVMSFNWVNNGIFILTNSTKENPKPPLSDYKEALSSLEFAQLESTIDINLQNYETINVKMPKGKEDVIVLNILNTQQQENTYTTFYIDQYTGKFKGNLAFADKNIGQKIRSYIKPIHTGEVFGLTSKIISFIIVLLTLTFPVTGVLMWLRRLKKQKAKTN